MGILLRYPEPSAPAPASRVALDAGRRARRGGAVRVGLDRPRPVRALDAAAAAREARGRDRRASPAPRARARSASRRAPARRSPRTTPAELIDDPAIDAVVIATRHDSHAALAAQALDAGKAVFLEKPLAIDAGGPRASSTPLLKDGGRLVVDFNRGFAPSAEKVARALRGPRRSARRAVPRQRRRAARRPLAARPGDRAAAGSSARAATSSTSAPRSSSARCAP